MTRDSLRFYPFACVFLFVCPHDVQAGERDAISIKLLHQPATRVTVGGLPPAVTKQLARFTPRDARWSKIFRVCVKGSDSVAILGSYSIEQGSLVFRPRFPFRPATEYVAKFSARRVPGLDTSLPILSLEFSLPHPDEHGAPARVTAVYPSSDVLPENLLRFYIHFSRPMSRGQAYRRLYLLDSQGNQIEDPFLELGEELWDPTGCRFTLFFDPGRVKRGLKPREEAGPVLVAGNNYTLVVDKAWRDARGQPLQGPFRKSFHAVQIDDHQPKVRDWHVALPRAGSRELLTVTFDEPLDHGMLERMLQVETAAGERVMGESRLSQNESVWSFRPQQPWTAGSHRLRVESILEDVAGNSLRRPFEVDVFRRVERTSATTHEWIPFSVPSLRPE